MGVEIIGLLLCNDAPNDDACTEKRATRDEHTRTHFPLFLLKVHFGASAVDRAARLLKSWDVECFFRSKYGMSQGLNTTLRNNGIESEGN